MRTEGHTKRSALKIMNSQDNILNKHVEIIDAYLAHQPINLICLKMQFISMLEYLSSPIGRTKDNCNKLDDHVVLNNLWLDAKVPDDFHSLMLNIAGALHDTFGAPHIAESCNSLPEQLLAKAKKLKAEPGHGLYRENAS